MTPLAAIKEQVDALSLKEQEELREWLDRKNFPPGWVGGDRDAFEKELRRRSEELDSGKVKGIPAEEVHRKMKAKYGL